MIRSALLALAAGAALGALLVPAVGARTASRGCGSMNTRYGYANAIGVTRTTCRTGRRVARAFNACRHRHHRGTRCRRQLRYRCTTHRRQSSPGQFYEYVRCTRGPRRITFINSVNT